MLVNFDLVCKKYYLSLVISKIEIYLDKIKEF